MLKILTSMIVLFGLWLLLSGLFKPLLIVLGLISCALAAAIAYRMEAVDGEHMPMPLHPVKAFGYAAWLMMEIAKANVVVARAIVARSLNINQKLFSVPSSQASDLASVVFANSITLTPGTITVETESGYFLVHALDHTEGTEAELAEMDHRVAVVETGDEKVGEHV